MRKTFVLPYLGNRTYLQGTTLLDFLLERYPDYEKFSFKISSMLSSNAFSLSSSFDGKAFAQFTYEKDGTEHHISMVEEPPVLPETRQPFDENKIIKNSELHERNVDFTILPSETVIRTAVALKKELLKRSVTHSQTGQWLFVRFDCQKKLLAREKFSLELSPRLTPVASSKIIDSQGIVGTLYFTWKNIHEN